MARLISAVKRFITREEAPTMVEYGLMVALIAVVVAIAAAFLGTQVSTLFLNVGNSL